ncbi:MAG: ATP-binding cassette domain-containing protein, partial [Anaerolineaceae bacterium]|nr:ATP-binding cassette domain-containing protein [Anaerolineaceae bacterium]
MLEKDPVLDVGSPVEADTIVLTAHNITKVFPGTVALDDVSFNVHKGKVSVLIGENGAGKSTLMKILAGVEQPTSGKVLLDGKEINLKSPLDASRLGIGIIYQELNLCLNLSVVDNIFLAREICQNGIIDKKNEKQKAIDLIHRLEQSINPNELVGELRIGQQQIVEIAKALSEDVSILIMDEPTASLSSVEIQSLFKVIRRLKKENISIIFVSHHLNEVITI